MRTGQPAETGRNSLLPPGERPVRPLIEPGRGPLAGEGDGRVVRSRWLGVELRHLIALAAVAREGSFRGAAERLGYVQSAISQQIACLERLLGVRLIERSRGPKRVEPTEAGRRMLVHVDAIVARLGAAQADLEAFADSRINGVRVGVPETVGTGLLPALLPALRTHCPEVHVDIYEGRSDADLIDLVSAATLDVTLAELPLDPGPLEATELLRDPYVLLIGAGTSIAKRGVVDADDLTRLPLIAPRSGRAFAQVEAELAERGVELRFVLRSDNVATIQASVACEAAAAILPRGAIDAGDPRMATIDLTHLLAPRRIGLVWHRDRARPAALDTFLAVMREAVACIDGGEGWSSSPSC